MGSFPGAVFSGGPARAAAREGGAGAARAAGIAAPPGDLGLPGFGGPQALGSGPRVRDAEDSTAIRPGGDGTSSGQ